MLSRRCQLRRSSCRAFVHVSALLLLASPAAMPRADSLFLVRPDGSYRAPLVGTAPPEATPTDTALLPFAAKRAIFAGQGGSRLSDPNGEHGTATAPGDSDDEEPPLVVCSGDETEDLPAPAGRAAAPPPPSPPPSTGLSSSPAGSRADLCSTPPKVVTQRDRKSVVCHHLC